jgi:hypothetical protein
MRHRKTYMNLQHVNVKIFVDGELSVPLDRFIEVFHRWVADQSMDEMMIDVADYSHVPAGPGIVMVGLEADYSIDNRNNKFGLLYNRKGALDGSNEDRICHSLRSAAKTCLLLESEFDGLRFNRQQFELFINDRALAPNDDATRAACEPILTACFRELFGDNEFVLEFNSDSRSRFGAVVSLTNPIDLAGLAE